MNRYSHSQRGTGGNAPGPPGGLTSQERFLLEWLSKEDFSSYGECEGSSLNVLVNTGLAEVSHCERGGWALVALTDAGRAVLLAGAPAVLSSDHGPGGIPGQITGATSSGAGSEDCADGGPASAPEAERLSAAVPEGCGDRAEVQQALEAANRAADMIAVEREAWKANAQRGIAALRKIAYLRPGGPTRNKLAMQLERIAIDALDGLETPTPAVPESGQSVGLGSTQEAGQASEYPILSPPKPLSDGGRG